MLFEVVVFGSFGEITVAVGSHTDGVVGGFGKDDGQFDGILVHQLQLFPLRSQTEHRARHTAQPQIAPAVEHAVVDLRHVVEQSSQILRRILVDVMCLEVVRPKALRLGGYPEAMLPLYGHRSHRHVIECCTQVVVGNERTLEVAMHLIALRAAAIPEVLASVEHEMIDVETRFFKGEAKVGLMQQFLSVYAVVEHTHRGADQQDVGSRNEKQRQHIGLFQPVIPCQDGIGLLPTPFSYIIYFKALIAQGQPESRFDDD